MISSIIAGEDLTLNDPILLLKVAETVDYHSIARGLTFSNTNMMSINLNQLHALFSMANRATDNVSLEAITDVPIPYNKRLIPVVLIVLGLMNKIQNIH